MFGRFLPVLCTVGCQGNAQPPASQQPLPPDIVVRDGKHASVAEMHSGHPCRATIGPVEMIIGGPPLVAQLGNDRWTGDTGENGTTLSRGVEKIARVFPIGDPTQVSVLDNDGIAVLRVKVSGGDATVTNAGGQVLRRLHTKVGGEIISDPAAITATGTGDLVLVALLSAPELQPEVRMLAACERVLVKGSK
ncbi:MAG TPA: hypothetical protein VLT45_11340 [Kofleriaceae bacterium]|nr:hypothetical protein [Kofleriaceae bacterium]